MFQGDAMDDPYWGDILVWSERQAVLLRRHAASDRTSGAIDWPNIIEDAGRSELNSVQSLLVQALRHWLKAEAWPTSRDEPVWRAGADDFRSQARRRFAPSMRQRIDVADLYADAPRTVPKAMDGEAPLPVPKACPFTLDQLLSDSPLSGD